MRLPLVLAAMAIVMPASAQPSFACSRATTEVERTICGDADLARMDREMATAFAGLNGRLAGPARDHLLKDQVRWNRSRAAACTVGPKECLLGRYSARITRLNWLANGPYPFISDQEIVKSGRVKRTTYEVYAVYPQFDGPADFRQVNTVFASLAKRGSDQAVPDAADGDRDVGWSYEQGFNLYRPSPHTISVETSFYAFTGGAHGNGGNTAMLVDLRSGSFVQPAAVFIGGEAWRRTIQTLVIADLRKQFVDKPGFEESLQPANMAKLLNQQDRYLFTEQHLQIIFNAYDVGPYAAGAYFVDIAYGQLRSLIRQDGPLGR